MMSLKYSLQGGGLSVRAVWRYDLREKRVFSIIFFSKANKLYSFR